MTRHVYMPGGRELVCGAPLRGSVAQHKPWGRICTRCRARLAVRPQLVNAIVAELRDSGVEVQR